MMKIKEKVIEEIELLPEDILKPVPDFVEYPRIQRRKGEKPKSKHDFFECKK